MSFLNLDNKRFLVMGVANRKSVAWAITKALEAEGAEVIHSVRSEARLESLRKLLGDRKAYLCDVEFPEQIAALAEQVAADYGPLDGIVHSIAFANYSEGFKPFHATVRKDFLQATAISAFSLSRWRMRSSRICGRCLGGLYWDLFDRGDGRELRLHGSDQGRAGDILL